MPLETEEYPCGYCKEPVSTEWCVLMPCRAHGFLPGDNVLWGDVFFHPECWDKQVEEHPP